tara:strand:- start:716 stop:2209 length:1494 start_codon:yes stop_codon:yes gene_type:complete
MSSYLENCTITSYSATETVGDNIFGENTLETQTLPNWFPDQFTASPGVYYLVIESFADYYVKKNMLTIQPVSVSGVLTTNTSNNLYVASSFFNNENLQDSISSGLYSFGQNFDTAVESVEAFDTIEEASCDNKIIIKVTLKQDFVMPAYTFIIKLNLNLQAQSCQDIVEGATQSDNSLIGFSMYSLHVTNFGEDFDLDLFIAKYHESASYANSPYNFHQGDFYGTNNVELVDYDPDGDWSNGELEGQEYNYQGAPCLQSFQPTCYTQYANNITELGYNDISNNNNLTTTCGAIAAGYNANSTQFSSDFGQSGSEISTYHPDSGATLLPGAGEIIYKHNYVYQAFSQSTNSPAYLSNGIISPGSTVLPNYLSWYISLGTNSGFQLQDDPLFVNVWKIVTYFILDGFQNSFSTVSNNSDCPSEDTYTALVSEKNSNGDVISNDSHLDINNVELFSVDDQTVQIKIPFKSDLSFNIFQPGSTNLAQKQTFIYVELLPNVP